MQKRVSGDDGINLHLDGNGEPHMVQKVMTMQARIAILVAHQTAKRPRNMN